jgi:ubiquinone/menaquinone biosynthesis C-methylase UbiE
MTEGERWQLHGSAPEMYERYLVPHITSLWAVDLIDRASPRAGERVLDLACGTGVVARLAAVRMGSGRVVAIDINTGMLAVARSVARGTGPAIEWLEGNALALPLPEASFDLVLCQLGLQFFPDRQAALYEMRRVLVPDGRIAISVYSSIEHTPATHALASALDHHFGSDASRIKRCEHAISDPLELRELVAGTGFRDVRVQTVTKEIRFPSTVEYVRLQLAATPLAGLVTEMDAEQREVVTAAITKDVTASLLIQSESAELTYPQEAFVVLAVK